MKGELPCMSLFAVTYAGLSRSGLYCWRGLDIPVEGGGSTKSAFTLRFGVAPEV